MPRSPSAAYLDGEVLPFDEARIPLDDRGLLFGESLYEVAPVVGARARLLEAHVARMRRGAAVMGLDPAPVSETGWEKIVANLQAADPTPEGLLYLQLTGGSGVRSHVPPLRPAPRLFAYLLEHAFPGPEATARGITAILVPETRWARRDLKTTMLLPAVLAKAAAAGAGAGEALFVGDGDLVLEGSSSNVFAVLDDVVVTPPLSPSLLPGITRQVTLELAKELGLATREAPLPLADLRQASEVFITSTSRLALPVTAIDGMSTSRGPVAERLSDALRQRLGLAP